MENPSKYYHVTYDKELSDTKKLISKIKESGWITGDVTLVNCGPDYSSRLVQMINHGLSHLNLDELFQIVNLEIPLPNMSQVWSQVDKAYLPFEKYLIDWVRFNVEVGANYLFIFSDVLDDKILPKIRSQIRSKLGFEQYRFASLYVQDSTAVHPDFFVELFNDTILYQWENMDNPNWI